MIKEATTSCKRLRNRADTEIQRLYKLVPQLRRQIFWKVQAMQSSQVVEMCQQSRPDIPLSILKSMTKSSLAEHVDN